jgi:CBS domain-containing protein
MRPITASDLMNPNVLAVREDMTLEDLAAFLLDNEITGAPVENGRGQLVGVVSLADIVRATTEEPDGDWTVADVMTPEVYSVPEDATVPEIASTLLDNHLHRLLVIRDDQPAGIISTSDLLGLLVDEDDD